MDGLQVWNLDFFNFVFSRLIQIPSKTSENLSRMSLNLHSLVMLKHLSKRPIFWHVSSLRTVGFLSLITWNWTRKLPSFKSQLNLTYSNCSSICLLQYPRLTLLYFTCDWILMFSKTLARITLPVSANTETFTFPNLQSIFQLLSMTLTLSDRSP